MKKTIVKILIFIIIIFIINTIIYYTNEDYNFFIKKIKNPEEIVYTKEKKITDEYKIENIPGISIIENTKKEISEDDKKQEEIPIQEKIYLGEKYKEIIKLFEKYNLKEIEINYNLFDLTEEYPDYYFEYYSKNITLYIFATKNYQEIKDVFEVIAYDSSFSLNEVNNFGDNSFYINLNEEIKDSFIRIVINNKNIVFGLKIKKDVYNEVKEILKNNLK